MDASYVVMAFFLYVKFDRSPEVGFIAEISAYKIPKMLPKRFSIRNSDLHQADERLGENIPYTVPDEPTTHQTLSVVIPIADVVRREATELTHVGLMQAMLTM